MCKPQWQLETLAISLSSSAIYHKTSVISTKISPVRHKRKKQIKVSKELKLRFSSLLSEEKREAEMLKLSSCNVADQIQALAQCRFPGSPGPFSFCPRSPVSVSFSPASRLNLTLVQAVLSAQQQAGTELVESGSGSFAQRLRLGSLTEDGLSYKEKFIVRCYEVGINKTATVETIANLLQEVGSNHAQSVGFSTDGFATTKTMRELHLIWVTARMHIEIYKYPAWSDVIEIETWCQSEGRIGTRRDWILKDSATGEVIGRATGKWVMMNQDTRRLQKVSDDVREEHLIFCPRKPKLAFPEANNKSLKKIPKLEDPALHSRLGLMPRRVDLDMNQHVNYVTYIGWVMESMPQEIIDTHELQTITLDYRRECQRGDVVDSLTSPESIGGTNGSAGTREDYPTFLHLLRFSSDGQEINRGRTEWRKKPAR
ncbi:oleoyl-acyl carrier protein thioesterase 1, chloroplastic-like [Durio zibethinus]|uniref:Acyl-[acyl-carrier-protein] hydrolase n=1 Tax=Durio zibethinus TaxID=66656 RepID=A0A6P5XGX1_DURZI|nr:oleoyl-acyl carrier protein thioesterase 1, chloroplastic-like [Durio zibethinus]